MSNLKKKQFKIFEIFQEWTESMTMHGFPNIFRTNFLTIRILWILFFLASNAFCFFIISRILINYFKFDVVTTIKVIERDSMPFPAVTVCNTNPFLTEESLEFVKSFLDNNNLTNFPNVNINKDSKKNFSNIFENYNTVRYIASSSSKAKIQDNLSEFSIQFEQMFISCLFTLQPCDENDWEWYYDYFYGNCFRFNTAKNSKGEKTNIKYSNKDGKYYGLMIELFVGTPNNQKALSLANGAHVFIDDNNFKPMTQRGYHIPTGSITNLAIKKVFTKLMPQPYSDCVENLNTINSFDSEYYRKVFRSNLTYRQAECFEAYISAEIYKNCKCEQISNNILPEKNSPCDTFDKLSCVASSFREILKSNYKSKLKMLCPLECESIRYEIIKSENKYPSKSYADDLLKEEKIKNLFSNRSNVTYEELSSNILSVNVYYEYLEQTEITQSASITWDGLVGSIGGTLGLFLGISVLSFAEFIDLLFQIIFLKSGKNKI